MHQFLACPVESYAFLRDSSPRGRTIVNFCEKIGRALARDSGKGMGEFRARLAGAGINSVF